MKFEREKDIPAFKGKKGREKVALFKQAMERDPWILRLQILICFSLFPPISLLSIWFVDQFYPHFLWLAIIPNVVVGCPIFATFNSLFIVPRIRRALDPHTEPAL